MKKIILLIVFAVILVGCNCKKNNDIKIKITEENLPTSSESSSYLYTTYGLLSYHLEDTGEYDEKVNNNDTFLLFVYSDTCFGCKLLAPSLKPSVDEGLILYTLDYSVVSDNHDLYKAGVTTTPYLVLVEDGEIVYVELIEGLSASDAEKNVKLAKKWINKHVEWGNN